MGEIPWARSFLASTTAMQFLELWVFVVEPEKVDAVCLGSRADGDTWDYLDVDVEDELAAFLEAGVPHEVSRGVIVAGLGFDEAKLLESGQDGREEFGLAEQVEIFVVMEALLFDMSPGAHEMPGVPAGDSPGVGVEREESFQSFFLVLKSSRVPEFTGPIFHGLNLHQISTG